MFAPYAFCIIEIWVNLLYRKTALTDKGGGEEKGEEQRNEKGKGEKKKR
jgi:hypothetical protein